MKRRTSGFVGALFLAVLAIGAYTLVFPSVALAKGKPPKPNKCGDCPCNPVLEFPDGTVCWLEACHLLYPYPDCLWDCHYVCPFPAP